ncbi:hypothetical protein BH11PSE9_BH11PSE9_09940 [soil metagenome]
MSAVQYTVSRDTVFLFDVDNTLLDNDAVVADLRAHLIATFGAACAERYWSGFEALRNELGYADYLGALQRYRVDSDNDPHPFADRLYPGAHLHPQGAFEAGRCLIAGPTRPLRHQLAISSSSAHKATP